MLAAMRRARPVTADPDAPTLSTAQLNRTVLARQRLLERSPAPLPRVLEAVACLQSQHAPSAYVGAWSRVAGLGRDDITAILDRHDVVQGWLMRATIHLASREDWWPIALAVRDARRAWWLRSAARPGGAEAAQAAAARLRAALADGPLPRREIEALIGRDATRGVGMWLDVLRVPPSATWQHPRPDRWAAAEQILGPPPPGLTVEAARELLVGRYLAAFGPAAPRDVATFTGIGLTELRPTIERVAPRRFRGDDGTELVDVADAPIADPAAEPPVRFLGSFDASLLAHCRRAGVIAEEDRPRIFHVRAPRSFHTFLLDGTAAGTWRFDGPHVVTEPWRRLDARRRRELSDEAGRLEAFVSGT